LSIGHRYVIERFFKWRCCIQPRLRIRPEPYSPGPEPFQGIGGNEYRPECPVHPPQQQHVKAAPTGIILTSILVHFRKAGHIPAIEETY